jgi:hypothetical protein
VAQVLEYLLCKSEVLSSSPVPIKKEERFADQASLKRWWGYPGGEMGKRQYHCKKKKRIKGWGCALVHSGSYKSFGMAETRMCAENDGTGIEDAG